MRTYRDVCRISLPVALLLTVSTSAVALPEYLAAALRYGARDCGFCHASADGGGGHNERGEWLLQQVEDRHATAVDVDWLVARDEIVEPSLLQSLPSTPISTLPPLTRTDSDNERPLDYTTDHGEWPAYAGDLLARKYSPLEQINRGNVATLQVAWVWEAFDNHRYVGKGSSAKTPDPFKATPLMAGNRLFIRTSYSGVAALDPATGETLWTFDPGTGDGPRPPMFGFSSRGLAYYRGKSQDRVVLLTSDGWLMMLNAETGEPVPEFGDGGRADLSKGLRRELRRSTATWNFPPALCGDVIVIGNQTNDDSHSSRETPWNKNLPLGDIRGFDAETGEQRWVFRTVPQKGEYGNETWEDGSWEWMGNTNVWSSMSCDPEFNLVYLPVTAPTHHFYGGHRPGDNLFATSVVAVDASTGKRVWHFQTVHHDIWDYDLPAAPVVIDIIVDGTPVKAVAQVGKTGFVYVLDRVTGKPVWPIEERPVPPSTLGDERAAKTQPFPTWPPPFESQGVTRDDLIDFTPALKNRAMKQAMGLTMGPLFTPAAKGGTLINPGVGGGANWGGASFDPETGYFYVASRRMAMVLTPRSAGWASDVEYGVRFTIATVDGLPIIKPPWGSITAYDMNTGEIAWQVANGAGAKDAPSLRHLNLPDLGTGQAPGLLITKTLMFYGQRRDAGAPTTTLQVRDKQSGESVASFQLVGDHNVAPPMTYFVAGRQFVVIATGNAIEPARLTAFRLP